HSGLAYGAAHDVSSAMAAMQGGSVLNGSSPTSSRADRAQRDHAMPTIVFHGDRDATVNVRNGSAIVAYAKAADFSEGALRAKVDAGMSCGGRACRRTVYVDATDRSIVEFWLITGAGHAWSGGNPTGSYTDARGPDASAEMVRFFLSQQRPVSQ
ncbi:MAG: PHB depolymerase family esterase, partial [Betaproteobacteria bacterium]